MSKYKTYPEYKNSGVEWLGDIPKEWITKKVRYFLHDGAEGIKIGPFGSALKLDDMSEDGIRVYGQENVINKNFKLGKRFISLNKFKEMSVYEVTGGDLLVTMMGTSGKCEIVPDDICRGIIDSHLIRLRIKTEKINSLLFRLLIDESEPIKYQIKTLGKGSIMHGLNSSIIKEIILPLPPIEEQLNLMSFLDYETGKLDDLIAKQQELIALLEEKRQAVISHAVTKGLDSSVPMKPSGVEWLGDIPKHWKVKKLKHNVKIIDGDRGSEYPNEKDYKDSGIPFLSSKNIKSNKLIMNNLKFISNEKFNKLRQGKILKNDLVITVRGTIGSVAIFNFDEFPTAFINAQMMILRTNQNRLLSALLHYICLSDFWNSQIENSAYGSTINQLSNDVLSKIAMSLPKVNEQKEIVDYLDKATTKIDNLISKANSAIELMRERRTALISAAVTGKIDVREVDND